MPPGFGLRLALVVAAGLGFIIVIALVEGVGVSSIIPSRLLARIFGASPPNAAKSRHQAGRVVPSDDDDDDQAQHHSLSRVDIDYNDPNADEPGTNLRGLVPRNDLSAEMRPVVIAGPSGVGKGTLLNMVLDYYSDPDDKDAPKGGEYFGFSVSHTTRGPRPGEVDGVHYLFSTREAMQKDIDEGKFIEYAEVHSNLYGTSFDSVDSVAKSGRICILDIDMQGVQSVKKSSRIDPFYVFVAPPSMEILAKRLRDRGTETEEALKVRTANAAKEVEYGTAPGNFDAVVVNGNLNVAFRNLLKLLQQWYPHLPTQVQRR